MMELNSRQLYAYLANVFLCPTREIDVFATCMTWWYENSVRDSFQVGFPDVTTLFVAFLNCVDFHSLSEGDIREMMLFPDIDTNDVIKNILTSIIEIKFGGGINRNVQAVVNILLNGNPRRKNNYPCVLIDPAQSPECGSFECFEERPAGSPKRKYTKYVVLFDEAASSNDVILEITQEKLHNLIGYHILGYKELIFLFGGEYYYGRGHWNSSFWVYNTIVERWERATKMNLGRRHFESCVVGNVVYLVGGTGNFRKLLDNMVWYNYKLNVWSDKIDLPCSGRQIKCCEHNNQLFLLDLNGRCGYLFDLPASRWVRLQINEAGFANVRYPEKFVVASDNDFIYIKGSRVIKLRVVSNKLEVIEERLLNEYNESMESTACNRALYTLYKHITTYKSEVDTDSFEKFDTSTYVSRSFSSYRVRSVIEGTAPEQLSRISNGLRVFTLAHYSMVKRTTYLTRFNV